MTATLIMDDVGRHNTGQRVVQLDQVRAYEDCSTICIVPTRGVITARVVQNWMGMMTPMNQKFSRMFIAGAEVGEAYNAAIAQILANPELSKWKYILTLEEDNLPPPDGLLKLYQSIGNYGAVGGLYWTKGPDGQPMIYGDPAVLPMNFLPQRPLPDTTQECNGLGMGFTLFRLDLFKQMPGPWFKTLQVPGACYTQDLYFFEHAKRAGFRFACDTRVRVGHYSAAEEIVW